MIIWEDQSAKINGSSGNEVVPVHLFLILKLLFWPFQVSFPFQDTQNASDVNFPSRKLTWLAGKSPFLIGDASSNGCFAIVMLLLGEYRKGICWRCGSIPKFHSFCSVVVGPWFYVAWQQHMGWWKTARKPQDSITIHPDTTYCWWKKFCTSLGW